MNIIFIGSGNVATQLALALTAAGHTATHVWSRQLAHAQRLAANIGAMATDKLEALPRNADLYIIAVCDDAIGTTAHQLGNVQGVVAHTSGSVAMNILPQPHRGVLWAPQTFQREASMNLSDIPFCYEASDDISAATLKTAAQSITAKVFQLDSHQRSFAHLASVMANNFGNALNALSQEMMAQHQIPFELLFPIIETTAQNAQSGERLWNLQTGPATRNDEATMQHQLQLLEDQPELQQLYRTLSEIIKKRTHGTD